MLKNAAKYLSQYGEAEVNFLEKFPALSFDEVVCIPAFNETEYFITSLANAAQHANKKVLLTCVINQPDHLLKPSQANQLLYENLHKHGLLWQNQHLSLVKHSELLNVLVIKRFQQGLQIPSKQGVGLARKIACDCAIALQQKNIVTSQQIYSSDADVTFPNNYFNAKLKPDYSACVFSFVHRANKKEMNNEVADATALYQQSMQHYVDGLARAGSIYAFHTIGSCLLIDSESYIAVRGFPKRAGGEDFYLLNKLNKYSPVYTERNITLSINARLSDRVPFGTGPAVKKILEDNKPLFYAPECFSVLKNWLDYLNQIAGIDNVEAIKEHLMTQQEIIQQLSDSFDLLNNVEKLWRNYRIEQRKDQLHYWFDGFKTLKLIHFLTEHHYPKLSLDALKKLEETFAREGILFSYKAKTHAEREFIPNK
jgi:hypothetical protein